MGIQKSRTLFPSGFGCHLLLPSLLLLASRPFQIVAQLTTSNGPASTSLIQPPTPTPTTDQVFTLGAAAPTSSNAVSIPTGYGSSTSTNHSESSGVLNYYFLLLAVFVVILLVAYWSLVRRRRNKVARSRVRGESALAQDVEGWTGRRPWGRPWRSPNSRGLTVEEGLDERGEAPPPYMPAFPPAVAHSDNRRDISYEGSQGQTIQLQNISTEGAKPPDYVEASTSFGNPRSSRSTSTLVPPDRYGSTRGLLRSTEGSDSIAEGEPERQTERLS
ncbi:hypothetical protein MMC12_003884 [Toensbergia leucococca]|nr:hypothetical protein [Toensbergia leucococca]